MTPDHEPPCASWEAHVERSYAELPDDADYDLSDFADFLMHTWDNERLADDPEFVPGGANLWTCVACGYPSVPDGEAHEGCPARRAAGNAA